MRGRQETSPVIGEVRGEGFYLSMEIVKDKATREPANGDAIMGIQGEMLSKGYVSFICGRNGNVFRLMPPLTTPRDYFATAVDTLLATIKSNEADAAELRRGTHAGHLENRSCHGAASAAPAGRRPRRARRSGTDLGHGGRGSRPQVRPPRSRATCWSSRAASSPARPFRNSGRLSVGAKSPLTGGIKEANSGGQAARKYGQPGPPRRRRQRRRVAN